MNWIKLTDDNKPPIGKMVLLLIEDEAIQGERMMVNHLNYQTGKWEE